MVVVEEEVLCRDLSPTLPMLPTLLPPVLPVLPVLLRVLLPPDIKLLTLDTLLRSRVTSLLPLLP